MESVLIFMLIDFHMYFTTYEGQTRPVLLPLRIFEGAFCSAARFRLLSSALALRVAH